MHPVLDHNLYLVNDHYGFFKVANNSAKTYLPTAPRANRSRRP